MAQDIGLSCSNASKYIIFINIVRNASVRQLKCIQALCFILSLIE